MKKNNFCLTNPLNLCIIIIGNESHKVVAEFDLKINHLLDQKQNGLFFIAYVVEY